MKFLLIILLIIISFSGIQAEEKSKSLLSDEEWAVLSTDLEKPDRNLLYPIVYNTTLFGLTVGGALLFYGPEELNWDKMKFSNVKANMTFQTYRWDEDRFFFNYIAHPLTGSESYLRARMRGFTPMESFLFSFCSSAVWEYLVEGWVEPVSVEDVFITPVAGSMLGELRFQGKLWLKKQNHILADIGAVAIDPIQSLVEGVYYLFSGKKKELPEFRVLLFYETENFRISL